jgi:hypothetical protein
MKQALYLGVLMLTASPAFAQYSTGTVGDQSFMMNTFQNDMGSYSTGTIGGQSFGITTFNPAPLPDVGPLSIPDAPMPPDVSPSAPNSEPYTGLMPENLISPTIPDKFRNRWLQCSERQYMDTHQAHCIADLSRIVVWLYIDRNRPVTSELNNCQQNNYAGTHPHECVKSVLDHFNKL